MTTANAIFTVGIILMALGLMVAAYTFRRPAVAFGSCGVWVILAVFSYGFSISLWDPFYILFWISIALVIISAMEGVVLRPKKEDVPEDVNRTESNWQRSNERYANFQAQLDLRRSGTIRARGRIGTSKKRKPDFENSGELE